MTVLSKVGEAGLQKTQRANPKLFLQILCLSSSVTSFAFLIHLYKKYSAKNQTSQDAVTKLSELGRLAKSKNRKPNLFFAKLRKIFKILVPRWLCPEVGYMGMISSMLIVRTLCDLWTIYLGTLLESAIISKNNQKFNRHLIEFALTMPTMSLVNSTLKYCTEQLRIRFRSRLTTHMTNLYLKNLTYYKLANNLGPDNNITINGTTNNLSTQDQRKHTMELANIDQLISSDVDRFCSSLANLYSQLSKPMLDIIIYVYGISASVGKSVPLTMMAYLGLACGLIVNLRRPMAKLTSTEQALEGQFRHFNSRLIMNCEEIAFYRGDKFELKNILDSFKSLIAHLTKFSEFKFLMDFFENIVAKYIATVVGYYSVSRPFLTDDEDTELSQMHHQQRLETYYKNGRMLLNLAQG